MKNLIQNENDFFEHFNFQIKNHILESRFDDNYESGGTLQNLFGKVTDKFNLNFSNERRYKGMENRSGITN